VTARLQYNGGHKSPANRISMAFACDTGGSQDALKVGSGIQLTAADHYCTGVAGADAVDYPVEASRGNEVANGYEVTCQLPTLSLAPGTSRSCTISVKDQREWGACQDMTVSAPGVIFPPSAPPPPVVASTGSYILSETTRIATTPPGVDCCAIVGSLEVLDLQEAIIGSFGVGSAVLEAALDGCRQTSDPSAASDASYIASQGITLLQQTERSWQGSLSIAGQQYELYVADGQIELQNVGQDTPIACDASSNLGLSPDGGGSGGLSVAAVVAIVVASLIGLGLGLLVLARYSRSSTGAGVVLKNSKPPPPPPRLDATSLPPDWVEWPDPKTGVPYYVNVNTKESTWVRPRTSVMSTGV